MRDKQANKVLNIHIYLYYIQRKQILPANFHPKYKLTKILSLNADRNRHTLDNHYLIHIKENYNESFYVIEKCRIDPAVYEK